MKQIIILGGRGFGTTSCLADDPLVFERYLLGQSNKLNPSLCFVGAASAEAPAYTVSFYQAFSRLSCRPTHLSLFKLPAGSLKHYILSQDIIFVGGGNTKSMLALFKAWNLDEYLAQAWQAGTILAGTSAGALCWFEQGVTDSLSSGLSVIDALGFLSGSLCPHYDNEKKRMPAYKNFLNQKLIKSGIGLDEYAGLHFIDHTIHRVINLKAGAQAYYVTDDQQTTIKISP